MHTGGESKQSSFEHICYIDIYQITYSYNLIVITVKGLIELVCTRSDFMIIDERINGLDHQHTDTSLSHVSALLYIININSRYVTKFPSEQNKHVINCLCRVQV